jgi:hypothetical protein
MSKRINPIIKPVVEAFQTTYYQTSNFAKNPGSAINGLLVMGDAGTGKSHWVKQALRDAGVQQNVEYIKGGTITAAALYVKLYLNRFSHRILVLDDVDIINHPEKSKIVPLILGAVEEGRDRQTTWSTAKKNALMEEFDVPFEFKFDGNIILMQLAIFVIWCFPCFYLDTSMNYGVRYLLPSTLTLVCIFAIFYTF